MKLSKYAFKWIGIMLVGYACMASAKPIINIQINNPPPPPPPAHVAPVGPGHYFWKPVQHGQIPPMAFVGGHEGRMVLYVCQAFYKDGVHAGKVVNGKCNIGWNGREIVLNNFNVLIGKNLSWRPGRHGRIPHNAVLGGHLTGHNQAMYVCRVQYGANGVHPGKLWSGTCYIGYGGREIGLQNYEILVSG